MYFKCSLNINTYWNKLPWKNIFFRILNIQRKILQATKNYEIKKIHILQKYLLNSNEAKVFAIQKIFNHYLLNCNSENIVSYKIKDQKKFFIFKHLFYLTDKYSKIYTVIEHIKQYIVYLCLQPEWQAKFIYQKNNYYFLASKIHASLTQRYNDSKYILNNPFNIKYIFIKLLINKIRALPYVRDLIKYWLCNNYYTNLTHSFSLIYHIKNSKVFNNNQININSQKFYVLINQILVLGLDWSVFHLSILKDNININNILDIITVDKTDFYKSVLDDIKLKLHANKYLSKIKKIIHLSLMNHLNTIFIRYIELNYKQINLILYFFFKKNKIYNLNPIISDNYYLNQHIYSKKIENQYIHLVI